MSGVKGRSGRKPTRVTEYKQWFDMNPGKIVELLEMLYEMGKNGDREAAIYVINRIAGTPKQSIDQRNVNVDFTPDDYIRLLSTLEGSVGLPTAERKELNNAIE